MSGKIRFLGGLAVAGLLAGCGAAQAATTSASPKTSFESSLTKLMNSRSLEMRVTSGVPAATVKRLTPAAGQAKALALNNHSSLTVWERAPRGKTLATAASANMLPEVKLVLQLAGTNAADVVGNASTFYVRIQPSALSKLAGPHAGTKVRAPGQALPPSVAKLPFAQAALAGQWVSLPANIAALAGVTPASSQSALLGVLMGNDVQVTGGPRNYTIKVTNVAAVANALRKNFGALSAMGGGATKTPSGLPKSVTLHATVARGALHTLTFNLAQLAPAGELPAGTAIPAVVTFMPGVTTSFAAPSGKVTPVDLAQLAPLMMAGSGAGAAG